MVLSLNKINIAYSKLIFLCGALLCVSVMTSCAQRLVGKEVDSDLVAQKYIEAAKAYIEENNTRQALSHLKKAETYQSKSVELFHTYALLYRLEGDSEREEFYYKKALREDKHDSRVKNNFGSFLCYHKKSKKGLKLLREATEDYSYEGRAESFVNRGVCELSFERPVEAEKSFQQALRLNAKSRLPYIELAKIYLDKNEIASADHYYQQFVARVAQQDPRSLLIGVKIAQQKKDNDAVSSYGLNLQKRFPNSPEYEEYLRLVN